MDLICLQKKKQIGFLKNNRFKSTQSIFIKGDHILTTGNDFQSFYKYGWGNIPNKRFCKTIRKVLNTQINVGGRILLTFHYWIYKKCPNKKEYVFETYPIFNYKPHNVPAYFSYSQLPRICEHRDLNAILDFGPIIYTNETQTQECSYHFEDNDIVSSYKGCGHMNRAPIILFGLREYLHRLYPEKSFDWVHCVKYPHQPNTKKFKKKENYDIVPANTCTACIISNEVPDNGRILNLEYIPPDTNNIRILNVVQPWAWALVSGFKDVENRSQHFPLPNGTWVLVLSSKSYVSDSSYTELKKRISDAGHLDAKIPKRKEFLTQSIVGAIKICKSLNTSDSVWYNAPDKAWVITQQIKFQNPIKNVYGAQVPLRNLNTHDAKKRIFMSMMFELGTERCARFLNQF
jgi:hypothetical protein